LIGSGLALSVDNFAVRGCCDRVFAITDGLAHFSAYLEFGAFQFLMTALGCLAGASMMPFVGWFGSWISLALL